MNINARQQLLISLQQKQPGWHIQSMDNAKCIYRTVGPYDIEVSGGIKCPIRFHIYVWKKEKVYRIVERVTDIDPQREDVAALVCGIADRYVRYATDKGMYKLPPQNSSNADENSMK